jgi:hypothetical protein
MGCGQATMKPLYQDNVELVQVLGKRLDAKPTSSFVSKEEIRRNRE